MSAKVTAEAKKLLVRGRALADQEQADGWTTPYSEMLVLCVQEIFWRDAFSGRLSIFSKDALKIYDEATRLAKLAKEEDDLVGADH